MVILSNTEKKASPFLKQEFLQFCAVSCDLALHFKLLNHCCGFHQWLEAQMFVCSFVCMYLLICFVYLFILFIFPHADTNPRHSNQKLINAFLQQKAGVEIWPVVIGGSLPNIGENIVSMPFFMARSVGLTVSELPGTLNSSLRQALSHTDGTAHRLMFSHNAPLHSAYLVYFIACFDSVAESVLKLSNVNLCEMIVWAHQLETI